MIRLLIWVFGIAISIALGLWLAPLILADNSYVLVVVAGHGIETSVPVVIGLVLFGYLVIAFFQRLAQYGMRGLRGISSLGARNRERQSRRLTEQGLLAFAEGEWARSERLMTRAARRSDVPLMNYLIAANAAQERGDVSARDNYLQQAYQKSPKEQVAIGLAQAKLYMQEKNHEQAVALVSELHQQHPKHRHVLTLLGQLYFELRDWKSWQGIAPKLKKYRCFTKAQLEQMEQQISASGIHDLEHMDSDGLLQWWDHLPYAHKEDLLMVNSYLDALIERDLIQQAVETCDWSMKEQWNSHAVGLFTKLAGEPAEMLAMAKKWYKKYGNEPLLLSCVIELALRAEQWQVAKDYLELAIASDDSMTNQVRLAQVYHHLGDQQQATQLITKLLPPTL
jgi:HemY protein